MTNIITQEDSYIVYGGTGCANCKQAVKLLNQQEKQLVYKSYPDDYSLEELADLVGQQTRSIPQIFKVGEGNQLEYIGGLMELVKSLKS